MLTPILFAAALGALALGLGRRLLGDGARDDLKDPLALTLGIGALASLLFLLGLAGGFTRGALLLLVVLVLPLAAGPLARAAARVRTAPDWTPAALVAGCGPVVLALYPPTAWDATIYHLPLARRLAETGALGLADNLRFPAFPLLGETLFGSGLLVADARAAQMVSALATLATAALLAAWGRERLGSSPFAALPAALWLGHPIVVYYAGTAFVEPLLALFSTAALYAVDRCRRDPGWPAAALAGACAGWAAAVKYLALPVSVLILGALVLAAPPGRRRRLAAAFAAGLALAAVPYYFWIWEATGNPVFPFFSGIFGATPWSVSDALQMGLQSRDAGDRLVATLRLPWDIVADRARVGWQPPFSPWVLAAVPACVWAALRAPWTRPPLAVLAMLAAGFGWLPADSRYLLSGAPALGLALAVAGERALELRSAGAGQGRHRAARALVLLALLPGPAYAAYHVVRSGGAPPVGSVATSAYLRRSLPLYGAVEAANRIGGAGATLYGLRAERTIYWFAGRQIGEWNGPYRFSRVEPLLGSPAELWRRLDDFDADLLLVPAGSLAALARGPDLERYFLPVHRDGEALLLARRDEPGPAPTN